MTIREQIQKQQGLTQLATYRCWGDWSKATLCAKVLSDRYPEDRQLANIFIEVASKNHEEKLKLLERASEMLQGATRRFLREDE